MMPDIQPYPPGPTPPPQATRGEQSAQYEGAFSKPGTTQTSKGWRPAKGTRFRSTIEKARGRKRKHPRDKRKPVFY